MNGRVWPMVCALVTSVVTPGRAHAGIANDDVDLFSASAFVGVELAGVDAKPLNLRSNTSFPLRAVLPGTAFGIDLGMRFRPLLFGVTYQRTQFIRETLASNKAYYRFGAQLPAWRFLCLAYFAFGYADIGGDLKTTRGVGSRVGLVLEYPLHRFVSAGVGASLDGVGYTTESRFTRSIGTNVTVRASVHL